jgi:hypothetical protein
VQLSVQLPCNYRATRGGHPPYTPRQAARLHACALLRLAAGFPARAYACVTARFASSITHMARAPSTFRQQDVTRAIKAATAAGVGIARVEIDKAGKIIIITGETTEQPGQAGGNDLDSWIAKRAKDARQA